MILKRRDRLCTDWVWIYFGDKLSLYLTSSMYSCHHSEWFDFDIKKTLYEFCKKRSESYPHFSMCFFVFCPSPQVLRYGDKCNDMRNIVTLNCGNVSNQGTFYWINIVRLCDENILLFIKKLIFVDNEVFVCFNRTLFICSNW